MMRLDKGYKYFISNSMLVTILWVFGVALSLACLGFALDTFVLDTLILDTFMLWGLISGVIAVSLIIAVVFATVLSRCCADYDGISAVVHWHRQFVAWQDISSVKISSKIKKSGIWYDITFVSDELTIKIKGNKNVITIIQEFGKNCKKFKKMFFDSLTDVVKPWF